MLWWRRRHLKCRFLLSVATKPHTIYRRACWHPLVSRLPLAAEDFMSRCVALALVLGSFSFAQAQYYKVIHNFGDSGDTSCPGSGTISQTHGGNLISSADSTCRGGANGAAYEMGFQG